MVEHNQHDSESYLSNLKFDPSLKEHWWAKYITNIRWVILLIVTILILGVASYTSLPTRLNPQINIAIVTVNTILPGAGPEDIETLLTKPIEKELDGVKGVSSMTSSSVDNVSTVVLQFDSNVSKEKARQDVQTAVDTVSGLPEDAKTPVVNAIDFDDQPIWTFSISSRNANVVSLMQVADRLKKQIEDVKDVDRVTTTGFEKKEIDVTISPEKMQELGLNIRTLMGAVTAATASQPAGSVNTQSSSFRLAIDPLVTTVTELRDLRLTVNNQIVRLGDIADVEERSSPSQPKSYLATAKDPAVRSVNLSVYKSSTADIDTIEKAVVKEVNEFPNDWFAKAKFQKKGIYTRDPELNLFKVNASQPLSVWRKNGWIYKDDPRGWFQWYCRYYIGRRSPDDERQIRRWRAIRRHIAQIKKNCRAGDLLCRPIQRQAVLHWAYDSRKM
jgi:multidrug efflux pump subunit AcrB